MPKEITVISISHLFIPHVGGIETFSYNLLSFLAKKSNVKAIALFCSDKDFSKLEDDILQISVKTRMLFAGLYPFATLKFFLKTYNLLKNTENKVVIINGRHLMTSLVAWFVCKLLSVKYIYVDSGFQPNIFSSDIANNILKLIDKLVFSQVVYGANYIIAISEYTKNILTTLLPKVKDKVLTVHTGFNVYKLQQFNIKNKQKIVAWVSRISEIKDPVTVMKAYEVLSFKYPEWKFILMGKGDFELNKNEYKLNSNVVIENKLLPQHYLFTLLSNSSIYINSSLSEGFSVANQEAAALGNVLVLSDAESNVEMAKELGIDSNVFKRKSVEDLILKISTSIENCEKTNFSINTEISKNAYRLFSSEVLLGKYYELITNLVN